MDLSVPAGLPSPPSPLSFPELAEATGTDPATLGDLRDRGLLNEPDGDGRYPTEALARVRLLLALIASGIDLDVITEAVERGSFALGFIDVIAPASARLLPQTHGELLAELDSGQGLIASVRGLLGTAGLPDTAPVRADDAALFRAIERASELGANEESLGRVLRAMAEDVRRMVAAQRDFIDEAVIGPLTARGLNELEAIAATAHIRRAYRETGRVVLAVLVERFADAAIFQNLVEVAERALGGAARSSRAATVPAIVFVDIAGYSRLAEEDGDDAAARTATRFATLAGDCAAFHGGELVKLLGDGVMLAFREVAAAVRCAVDLVGRAAGSGLPPLHIGVDCGPVIRRDGDYFGSVVNIASRAANAAGPGEVLVTDRVVLASEDPDLRFQFPSPTPLKNIAASVVLWRASSAAARPESGWTAPRRAGAAGS